MNEQTIIELLKLTFELTKLTVEKNKTIAAKKFDSIEKTFEECRQFIQREFTALEDSPFQ